MSAACVRAPGGMRCFRARFACLRFKIFRRYHRRGAGLAEGEERENDSYFFARTTAEFVWFSVAAVVSALSQGRSTWVRRSHGVLFAIRSFRMVVAQGDGVHVSERLSRMS